MRIIKIERCDACPFKKYSRIKNEYWCWRETKTIKNLYEIPDWCPLPKEEK